MELNEKILSSAAGWQVFQEARKLRNADAVLTASWSAPLLRGTVRDRGKTLNCGLRIRGATDVENLCSCAEARRRGIICSHSVAVGLACLHPATKEPEIAMVEKEGLPKSAGRESGFQKGFPQQNVLVRLEGSTRSLVAEVEVRECGESADTEKVMTAMTCELERHGFRKKGNNWMLQGERDIQRFYAGPLLAWEKQWKVELGERFQHVTSGWIRLQPRVSLVDDGRGWLDFRLHYTAGAKAVISAEDLRKLLAGGQSYFRLKSGEPVLANPAEIEDWEEVVRDCDPKQEGGSWKISHRCGEYVRASAAAWGADFTGSENSPLSWQPGPLVQQLRPYQQEGFHWMARLAQNGLGGLLADEMGLGKTVQALALLETMPGRSLVICPSSLVWNWKAEAQRFCPGLSVVTLGGADREEVWRAAPDEGLFITSYALLRRDIAMYRNTEFAAVILDEAQHIKNPESQRAKAACSLQARARFVLTGTPLENSLGDLWSLFAFLLPGYLGSRKNFQERYEVPLRDGSGGAVWARLQRRIGPFFLRRRKAELLPELPEKIEQTIEVPLGPQQRVLYDQLQAAAREKIDLLQRGQAAAARMQVLTALLRLRQCCCDSRLLGAPVHPGGEAEGKLAALLEILAEVVDGGHRALVFSQFTGMLDIMEPLLQAAGFRFVRLDGSTRDRQKVVEEFQKDEGIPVFLISLKAGGVGLNLTGADIVIHFDPWWNPAVEAQATDRAHRIGQQRVVTSIKLIAADTVEARVLRLQEEKRALLAHTLDSGEVPAFSPGDLAEIVG